jgi:hypothetical protein
MGKEVQTIGCLETSVHKYHSTLRNTPEERRSHLDRGGSQKSRPTKAHYTSSGISLDTVTTLRVKNRKNDGSIPGKGKRLSRPQSAQTGSGSWFFLGAKRSGRKADHITPSSAEVKNEWSYTCIFPICSRGVDRNKITLHEFCDRQPTH